MKHPVIEVFGPTIQGEGELAGQRTLFVRFGGCDFRCSWCDSMHAVEPALVRQNAERLTDEEIIERISSLDAEPIWVTLSGGNPALMKLDALVPQLQELGYRIAVETQGSVWRDWLSEVDLLTISPKPPSSGMATPTHFLQLKDFIERARAAADIGPLPAVLKIVVFDDADLNWAQMVFRTFPDLSRYLSVGTDRPVEGETMEETLALLSQRTKWLFEEVARSPSLDGVTVLPQTHVLAWGHALGV